MSSNSSNISKVSSSRPKPKRMALNEVSNTQKSESRWLLSDARDSKEVVNSLSMVTEEYEKDSTTQKTENSNITHEINIPTPRKVSSPAKVTWYYLPRVVIPIVSPPEVTVDKPNIQIMKSNESSLTTIKKNSKKSKSSTKKSQPNNNSSLLNWFSPSTSSNDQQSGSDESFISNPTFNENENKSTLKEISNSTNVQLESRSIANIGKRRLKKIDESDPNFNVFAASLPALENVDLGAIDMNLITDIIRLYDFIVKFEKPLGLDLDYNGDKLTYVQLEEMILDNRFHTRLAYLQSELLSFVYKESDEECDIDPVNLQYFLTERYPNRKFLLEKECPEFSPRERMLIFEDLMNEALCTNKLREFIKELTTSSCQKKENDIRMANIREIKFKINEIRVRIINRENELKDIEKQFKEKTMSFENDYIDLPNAVTKRQKVVAKRKAEQEALNELNERRKVATDEIELLLHKLDKLEIEHRKLNMLNKTERDHTNCILRGGSILNPSGRDERFYMFAKLGQDRDGRYYWFFRTLGGIFVETVKWNYPEQDSDDLSLPLTSPSEWQFISGIGIFRKLMAVLNSRGNREKVLKTNLKILEKEIEPTFDRLNLWLEKKRNIKTEYMEVDSEEVKSIMGQRQKSFWKLFDTVIRKRNVWSLEEYHIIMEEYVKRKIADFEKILRNVDPNLVFNYSQGVSASDLVSEVKNMISETGLKFMDHDNASITSSTSSKKDKSWDWLYNVAVDWYLLDIKTFSTLAVWLDVMVEAGEPVVRSIKKRMQEQLAEKFKCPTRLRVKKGKAVEYKEENTDDEIEEDDAEEQKPPSKWSLRDRKRVAYK
ncbi:hypothetical protein C1645_814601 [Glomus cerebriforme]|uniref:WHIM2 domain-containing protein n=1 Tax=Glomus cerebriforme TaxID=658196 RepID=A0A397TPW7_9GLOM|nr:hypothetical protein C1645_814601 [Glomus cerebriforme]